MCVIERRFFKFVNHIISALLYSLFQQQLSRTYVFREWWYKHFRVDRHVKMPFKSTPCLEKTRSIGDVCLYMWMLVHQKKIGLFHYEKVISCDYRGLSHYFPEIKNRILTYEYLWHHIWYQFLIKFLHPIFYCISMVLLAVNLLTE